MKRVLIEFYSERTPENFISLLSERYDEVYFFAFRASQAPKKRKQKAFISVVEQAFGLRPKFVFLEQSGIEAIIDAFPRIRKDFVYDVDLTGGNEFFLAAAGIWQERAKGKVFLHRYDVTTGRLVARYPEREEMNESIPRYLNVPQILTLSGTPPISAPQYSFSFGSLREEILRLWEAVKPCLKSWNTFCSMQGSLREKRIDQKAGHQAVFYRVYRSLCQAGLAGNEKKEIRGGKTFVSFDLFVSDEALFLYDKAGTLLEMYASLAAFEAGVFHDIRVGVTLDWNGSPSPKFHPDPRNEVDLVLMRKNLPVLASCKNTEPHNEYLYEIMTMARHYGGYFATPMLLSSQGASASVRQRAGEMNIVLIDRIGKMDFPQFVQRIREIFS